MSTQTSMMMISQGSLPMALKEGSSLMRAGCAGRRAHAGGDRAAADTTALTLMHEHQRAGRQHIRNLADENEGTWSTDT